MAGLCSRKINQYHRGRNEFRIYLDLAVDDSDEAVGTAPKPSLRKPMPNLSRSWLLPLRKSTLPCTVLTLIAVSTAFAVVCDAVSFSASFRARSSSSSRCLSYPSCLIRSASSAALRSASTKSMGVIAFFAPRPPSLDFFCGLEVADEPIADVDDVRRVAPSLGVPLVEVLELDRIELDVAAREVTGRPITGGDMGAEVEVTFGEAGFSHEEKKSSSPCAVSALAGDASTPSTTTRAGKLRPAISLNFCLTVPKTHLAISSLTRLASSSLYSSAARHEYFFLVSASVRRVAAPCRVKNSVADVLPPTFIVRSWFSCQLSRFVDLPTMMRNASILSVLKNHAPDKTYVYTHIPMDARAI